MLTLTDSRLTPSHAQQKNLEVAQRINRETRADVASPYTGKTIGVWHEEVVAVGDSLDEVSRQLDALGDENLEAVCIQASVNYEKPIWMSGYIKFTLIDNGEDCDESR